MTDDMNGAIRRASLALILMLVTLAAVTGYWQVALGASLAGREDNPRRVLAERQIPRGAIQDRNGKPLAVSQRTEEGYVRFYPEPLAAPVVGYYSLRYGLGGAEEAFDNELRGLVGQTPLDALVNQMLHRVPPGRSVRLTLDATVQRAADEALAGRAGAVVVLSVPDGEVIALASHPTFDPAKLDQDWEALRADPLSPLLNRATQGAYQPGAAFQTIVLAEVLSRGVASLTSTVATGEPVRLGNTVLTCATPPISPTLGAAYAAGCPAPFDALAGDMDANVVADMLHRWQLETAPTSFELPVHVAKSVSATLTTTLSVRELILGQGALTLSPLQMASAFGTVVNGGRQMATPHLTFQPVPASPAPTVVSPRVAGAVQSVLSVRNGLAGQVALAVSGERQLAWFVGYAPAQSPRWVIVVLLEDSDAVTCYQVATATRAKLTP